MNPYRKLTREYEDYLLRLCFGAKLDLDACINSAYLDFNRTLHGMGKLEDRGSVHAEAVCLLTGAVENLRTQLTETATQENFDIWHKAMCEKLRSVYSGKCEFHAGQAQKWVNMTFKYIYTLGEEYVSGFSGAYAFCHIPLDNIVLEELGRYDAPAITQAWSRLGYDSYIQYQLWVRKRFAPVPPLDVEFRLWMRKGLDRRAATAQLRG